jgi:hypothetical protein
MAKKTLAEQGGINGIPRNEQGRFLPGAGRWKPGQSGNPNGRKPKADCLISCIKEELGKPCPNGKTTNEQLIASVLVGMATRGNIKAIEMCLDYINGRPGQAIQLTGGDGGAVLFKIGEGYKP